MTAVCSFGSGEPDGATGNFRPTANHRHGNHTQRLAPPRHRCQLPRRAGERHRRIRTGWSPTRQSRSAARRSAPSRATATGLRSPYVLSNRLFFRSGAAPSAFGAFVDTAAQGFYFDDLFYAVADQSAPAIRLAAYATGFEPGYLRRFDPGPGRLVRRNDPDRRERRPGRRPDRCQPTHRDGSLADLEQHLVGQLQRELRRVGVRPGPPGVRWPAVIRGRRRSVHRDAVVPLRECVSRWLQHRDRSRERRSAMTATPSWR